MDIQKDGLANVARVFIGEKFEELDPDEAEALGEELIRAARDVRTEQSTLFGSTGDGQMTLAEGSDDSDEEAFVDLMHDDDDWDVGDVLADDYPMKW